MFDWLKTSPRLNRRVRELEELVGDLKRDVMQLEAEWNTTYESLKRLQGKLAKREKRAEQEDCGCGEATPLPDSPAARDQLLKRARERYRIPGMG